MPPAKPDEGKAHFIFAMKGAGQRIELCGQLPIEVVVKVLNDLIAAHNETTKDTP